jgi:hypothetical protein
LLNTFHRILLGSSMARLLGVQGKRRTDTFRLVQLRRGRHEHFRPNEHRHKRAVPYGEIQLFHEYKRDDIPHALPRDPAWFGHRMLGREYMGILGRQQIHLQGRRHHELHTLGRRQRYSLRNRQEEHGTRPWRRPDRPVPRAGGTNRFIRQMDTERLIRPGILRKDIVRPSRGL